MSQASVLRLASVMGFLGVALGAFGAHGFQKILEANDRLETWETAVTYHLVHSVALLTMAFFSAVPRVAVWSMGLGIVLFSGSLYVLCLSNLTKLGAFVTPLGGVAFLVGWAALALKARSLVSAGE